MTQTQIAARLSAAGVIVSVVTLLLLHLIRSDLDPLTSVLSEYALGQFGWLGNVWFIALAIACGSLSYALWPTMGSHLEVTGAALLVLGAIGLVAAAIFPMDPAGAGEVTTSGLLHGIAGMIGMTSLVLATLILGWKLARKPHWSPVRGLLISFSVATALAEIGMTAAAAASGGQEIGSGSASLVGLGNRLLMVAITAWLLTVSLALARQGSRLEAN
jgi:hypothetical protein